MVRLPISLVRGNNQQVVEAILLELNQQHVADFHSFWQASLRRFSQEDKYWDWAFKQRLTVRNARYESYAVECDGCTQGLMMLETEGHASQFYPGKRLVYVAALSVAPWNRRQVQRPPRFKTVGSVLLNFSRLRSLELGYEGRVGLHALPGAEGFYERKDMMRLDPDPDDFIDAEDEQLTYFEYPAWKRR
ncbi:GNAT family N-acetyltransferase [Sphaerothrix gracilis]|uniref:GNAT family N-acetyltransferase n=1 Tax=Sphaerothrix gracilis TaxID=3151835 RepID=UPI0031FC79D4